MLVKNWSERSVITANLLNPAFCGEVIRRTVYSFNENENGDQNCGSYADKDAKIFLVVTHVIPSQYSYEWLQMSRCRLVQVDMPAVFVARK